MLASETRMDDHVYPSGIAYGVPISQAQPTTTDHRSFSSASNVSVTNNRASRLSAVRADVPPGLCSALARSCAAFPLRIMIIDNSGSMAACDGTRLLRKGNSFVKLKCSRWQELLAEVVEVAEVADALQARTDFHLLNPAANFRAMTICPGQWGNAASSDGEPPPVLQLGVSADVETLRRAMREQSPGGTTPLTEKVMEVVSMIEPAVPSLTARGEKVAVILATDGLPNDKRSFLNAMKYLQTLPVWVVVRLCTDDDAVVQYWNDLDASLEQPLEVLDDCNGEAKEVGALNAWLTYSPVLHLARLWGLPGKLYDALDEVRLVPAQIKEFVEDVLGCDDLPEPELDPNAFVKAVTVALGTKPALVCDASSLQMRPWLELRELERAVRPRGESGCVLM